MSGWKTWLGGLVAVMVGITGITFGYLEHDMSAVFIAAGFAAMGVMGIGLGHKMEKTAKK